MKTGWLERKRVTIQNWIYMQEGSRLLASVEWRSCARLLGIPRLGQVLAPPLERRQGLAAASSWLLRGAGCGLAAIGCWGAGANAAGGRGCSGAGRLVPAAHVEARHWAGAGDGQDAPACIPGLGSHGRKLVVAACQRGVPGAVRRQPGQAARHSRHLCACQVLLYGAPAAEL